MNIKFNLNLCEKIKEISVYNLNYYKLPLTIKGCNVIEEICHEDYNYFEDSIGIIIEGKYKRKYYTNIERKTYISENDDIVEIDEEKLDENSKLT